MNLFFCKISWCKAPKIPSRLGNFSSELHLFRYNKDFLSITDTKIEINFKHFYDVLFNLQPTVVNFLNKLIQFQSNYNSILELTCQKELWCGPFQIKKRKTKFKIWKFVFWFEMRKQISKNIFHFSILINELKNEKRKNFFLNLFWFKTNFKKLKSKFSN